MIIFSSHLMHFKWLLLSFTRDVNCFGRDSKESWNGYNILKSDNLNISQIIIDENQFVKVIRWNYGDAKEWKVRNRMAQ